MKQYIKEKHKLPLTFKFAEEFKAKNADKNGGNIPYAKCEKYQSDFLMLVKPFKSLVRML
ncbi:hypothetical protein [Pedobacter sp. UBA5917]|jgi:hypothetical protein|uniref:hypothetical protein n=1 Tax=Pedobacter sp. UBA5917 TaxID=1947061 RepID=UPI0025F74488|nr:hypothetical protein [Pedobacter sp. UBA5917]